MQAASAEKANAGAGKAPALLETGKIIASLGKTHNAAVAGGQVSRVHKAAIAYFRGRLSVVPASSRVKHPVCSWTRCRTEPIDPRKMEHWPGDAIFVVCGAISGRLEILDFDDGGSRFDPWRADVEANAPGLLDRLVIERSPSGGRHVFYRCPEVTIPKGRKLARKFTDSLKDCLIEVRGEGDGAIVYPSPGYQILQGRISRIPSISAQEREALHIAARRLNVRLFEDVVSGRGVK